MPSRSIFLKTIALSVTLTLAYVAIKPAPSASLDRKISLPTTLALPGWEAQSTQAIAPQSLNSEYHRVLSGQQYTYRQHHRLLQIAIRDVVDTEGDISLLMTNFQEPSSKVPELTSDRQSSRGFYRLFTQENHAYLQSCLNRNGYTTITASQFRQNSYQQALRPQQWLNWLTSQRPLLEHRCLWIRLSTPVVQQNVQEAYTTLEQNWTTLISSWQSF